ncbi:MAG: DUF5110 domain-containing protein [Micropruina glycogenica]
MSPSTCFSATARTTGTLYEDDGKTEAYKKGGYNTYRINVSTTANGSVSLSTKKTHAGYSSKLKTYDVVLRGDLPVFGGAAGAKVNPSEASINADASSQGVKITKVDAKSTVTVRVPISAANVTIAFEGK